MKQYKGRKSCIVTQKKKAKSFGRRLVGHAIFLAATVLLLVVVVLLCKNEGIAEYMTRTVSRFLLTFLGKISSVFSFSVFEVLLTIVILLLIASIVMFFVRLKKKGRQSLLGIFRLASVVVCFVIFYQLCVGFAYYRKPPDIFGTKEINDSYAQTAAQYFTDDFVHLANSLERDENGCVVVPYTTKQLNKLLQKEYERLDNDYLNPYTPSFKKIKMGFVMAELKIVGVYVGPLGEPNITSYALDYERPFIAAHEIAHAKGVMRESEADLIASYLLLTSDNPYLRYSGYMFNYFDYLLLPIAKTNNELYNELYEQIPQIIRTEFWKSAEIYHKYNHLDKLLDNFGDKMNSIYLWLNGQKNGTDSYDDYGNSVIIDPPVPPLPTEPGEPPPPPVYTHLFSFTEQVLLSICPL